MKAQQKKTFFFLRFLCFPIIVECFLILSFLNSSTRGSLTIMESTNTTTTQRNVSPSFSLHNSTCSYFEEGDLTTKTFYSPNYPNSYSNSTNCIRLIEAEPGKIVRIDFLDYFDIEPGTRKLGCLYDYLEIRDGKFGYSPPIIKLCGNTTPTQIMSSGRHLWLRFKSDENIQHRGFKAVYSFIKPTENISTSTMEPSTTTHREGLDNPCYLFQEGNITTQTFYSPNYPNNYPNSIYCVKIIQAEQDKIIRLEFLDYFDLEPATNIGCFYDFLDIRDGRYSYSLLIKRLCGQNEIPMPFVSSGPYLWLTFKSDITGQHKGFKVVYSYIEKPTEESSDPIDTQNTTSMNPDGEMLDNPCLPFEEGNLETQTFYSPNYPNTYPNSTICERIIEADPDKIVSLSFRDFFDIESAINGSDCPYDSLEIRDGKFHYSHLIATFCGRNEFPSQITSTGRYLWLRFKSDENNQYKGFKAVYSFIDKPMIESPVPIESQNTSVAIRGRRELLENPCLPFEEGDPGTQTFYSPNYPNTYPNSTICERIIEAEPDKMIRIDFLDFFEIEPATTGPGCPHDFLEVRDGKFGYSHLIDKFCGKNKYPSQIISSGRYLWLRFKSDENIQYSGFKAVYSFIDKPSTVTTPELERCYKEVTGIEGFIIKTDIDPEIVKKSVELNIPLDCMWKVTAEEGSKVQLYFETFELGKPNECDSNYIEIYPEKTDEPSRLNSFCGSIAEERISSKTRVLHVRFMADSRAFNKTNFKILYTSFRDNTKNVPCREDEYDCQDATCISLELKCNKNVNCRYLWDESPDECAVVETAIEKILKDKRKIVILVIFFFILTGMCFSFIYNCTRKLVRDHKIIQENKRKSRESRLDQIGRKPQSVAPLTAAKPKVLSRESIDSSERSTSPGLHMSTTMLHQNSLPSSHYTPKPVDLIPILTESKGCGTEDTSSHDDLPTNGDAVFIQGLNDYGNMHDDDQLHYGDDLYSRPMPEMRDSECQTRESLFQNISYTPNSSGDGSLTPPPLPPSHLTRSNKSSSGIRTLPSVNSRSTKSPGTFTTFGYNKNNKKPPSKPRYRAEAVIEMDKGRDKSSSHDTRPFSVQSTKSAPDVIFTH